MHSNEDMCMYVRVCNYLRYTSSPLRRSRWSKMILVPLRIVLGHDVNISVIVRRIRAFCGWRDAAVFRYDPALENILRSLSNFMILRVVERNRMFLGVFSSWGITSHSCSSTSNAACTPCSGMLIECCCWNANDACLNCFYMNPRSHWQAGLTTVTCFYV